MFYSHFATAQIKGIVKDETGQLMVGAVALLTPDSLFTTTDKLGRFEFKNLPKGSHHLYLTYLGYEAYHVHLNLDEPPIFLTIFLKESSLTLEAVEVAASALTASQGAVSSVQLDAQFLERNQQGTFVKSIEKIPGVSAINVGVGIAKPVIRGLSFNRVIVNTDGVKQEGQQWGSDHGLEIDPFDVERVELIKGAAALQYGSDGLGGVINVLPHAVPAQNSLMGSVSGVFKSNNRHIGTTAYVAANRKNFFVIARYSRQDFADYRVPADRFVYNGFELPIFDFQLKNTAGLEENVRASVGYINNNWVTQLTVSHYDLKAGIFSGAVGIPRSYALEPDGDDRDRDAPSQTVQHTKVVLQQQWEGQGGRRLKWNVGYQNNLRQEFSFPEFHNAPNADPNNTMALQLKLQTWSSNGSWEFPLTPSVTQTIGWNAQSQRNQRAGFEYLLPDFHVLRVGGFVLNRYEPRENWQLTAGLRLDYAHNKTQYFQRFVWNSNAEIIDTLRSPARDDHFLNYAFSVGSVWKFETIWQFKLNFGKSFRVPYPAETVSNGVHHGTFRHELGTPDLRPEEGYQLDAALEYRTERLKGSLAAYFNFFDDFIYLAPTAQFSTLPEAGQIYQYTQTDAVYTGFELDYNYLIIKQLDFHQAIEYVWNVNLETSLGLPFTPPASVLTELTYDLPTFSFLRSGFVTLGHRYVFAQNRTDRNEATTPDYHLWEVGLGGELKLGKQSLFINFQMYNMLNISYLNHLSRYRILNIPEQGLNAVVSVRLPFLSNGL